MIAAALLLAPHVLIGNFLTTAPSGIAFVVDDKAAFAIDTGAPYQAGIAAPDDSYHRIEYPIKDAKVVFEWGRKGNAAVAQFSVDKPVDIPIHLVQSWPDMPAKYQATSQGASGVSMGVDWQLAATPAPIRATDSEIVLQATPERPARFIAGIGPLPSIGAVVEAGGERAGGVSAWLQLMLEGKPLAYLNRKPKAEGSDWGDFLGAIADNLNNSRIYSSDNHMLAHSVSRRWAPDPNSAPYFCWDSFFNGNLASIDDPGTARNTVRAILSCQTPEGLVPNFGHWSFGGGRASNDRSQPPVGAMCVWKMHERWPDVAFLKEVYPKLLKWHRWWPTARDGNKNGLLEWGSSTGQLQGAKWETGWDDTVHFEGAQMVGSNMNADAIDLNSMWAMDAEYLAAIATAIGLKDDASALAKEHRETCDRINKELWSPALGMYCSKLWSGDFLTRLTPMNFYPLVAGVPDADRAKKIFAVLTDPKKFWGEWLLPTVAYDDPVWPDQDYWKGKVWAPVNYLVFQGLLRYGTPEMLNYYADRSRELFMRNWTAKGVCGENYLSKDGTQSSDPHYTWGALLCLVELENVCHLNLDGTISLNGTMAVSGRLRNVPIRGKRYDVVVRPGAAELVLQGKIVLSAHGEILRSKLP